MTSIGKRLWRKGGSLHSKLEPHPSRGCTLVAKIRKMLIGTRACVLMEGGRAKPAKTGHSSSWTYPTSSRIPWTGLVGGGCAWDATVPGMTQSLLHCGMQWCN